MPLRVIAGELRGRKLRTVPGRGTRPTADRIREAVFSILGSAVPGSAVLDLFAGTGAYGIEALSRGAAGAVFVEIGREALQVLQANLAACGLSAQSRVIRCNAAAGLNCLTASGLTFDLVFIDPPYEAGLIAPALRHLLDAGCLSTQARIVVEHGAGEFAAGAAPPYALRDRRCYGKTLVSLLDVVL
jgi:16S rRNA (guanine(966)-N(2))-methyltransferase RsmD